MSRSARPKPRYLELAEHFTDGIASGLYPIGGTLPTEREICASFSVSRHTARAALAELISAGLVLRRPGSGTRVLTPRHAMRYEHEFNSIDDLLQYGGQTRLEVLSARCEPADASQALQLGLAEGSQLVLMRALRFVAPSPVAIGWADIVIPVTRGLPIQRLLDAASAARTIHKMLDPTVLAKVEQIFDACDCPDDAANALGIESGSPTLRIERHYRDASGRLLAYAISLHPTSRFAYRMALTRKGG